MSAGAVVCLSANPGFDRRLRLPSLALGEVNRAATALAMPGGKATHVAMAVLALGARAVWIGFLGGATGAECSRQLQDLGVEVHAVETASPTRINLEVIEDSGRITEILEPGGPPDVQEQQQLLGAYSRIVSETPRSVVTISGSLPPGVPPDFYIPFIDSAHGAGCTVMLDTSGEALRAGLAGRPDLVKPNRKEAEALLGRPVPDADAAAQVARQIIDRGARSAAITLGANGVVWLDSKGGAAWLARPPRLKPISTVGSGDATLAGFAWALIQGMAPEETAKLAAACGAANCLAEFEGRISLDVVRELMQRVETTRLAR